MDDHPPLPAPAESPSTAPPLQVLYVEDNRINAMLFDAAMRTRSDIELHLAEDGAEALSRVADLRPDVLVLDAHLPDMDGYELLVVLRGLPGLADTPAFMCSADAKPEDLERARRAGFIGYWTKPVDIVAILADLDRLRGAV